METHALAQVPEVEGIPSPRESDVPLSGSVGGRWHGWRPLSLAPAFTLERVFWYVPLLFAFLMFHAGSRDPERRRVFEAVLFLDFLALALFGLVFAAIGNDKLYWIRPIVQDTNPFGPYVNPANFGAVMELAVPWVVAAAWSARRLKRRSALPIPILLATGVCCMFAGVLSGSRAALVLITVALVAVALVVQRERGGRWMLTSGLVGALAIGSLLVALSNVGGRLARFFEFGPGGLADVERLAGWRGAWTMLTDFLLTGAGIGAFREVFPIYAPAGGDARMRHLHNDYLEVVVETGWPGALLLVWLIGAFAWLALRNSKRSITAKGLLIGLACLFAHAAVDFNHQIPANALLFVAAAGMIVSREEPE
jgi:O-antigen ligase